LAAPPDGNSNAIAVAASGTAQPSEEIEQEIDDGSSPKKKALRSNR